jgi:SPP1 family predicted phage head-tail adaptor
MSISAGDLTERVNLVRDVIGRVKGVESRTPEVYASVWASVRFLSGREQWKAQQVSSTANVEVTIRYRADVLASDHIEWNGYRLEIKGEPTVDVAGRESVVLMCEARRA